MKTRSSNSKSAIVVTCASGPDVQVMDDRRVGFWADGIRFRAASGEGQGRQARQLPHLDKAGGGADSLLAARHRLFMGQD